MSVRTFTRRFRQETGLSPAAWLTSARLEHARHLLESTELPVDDIAARTCLGSGTNLRRHIRDALESTPLRLPQGIPLLPRRTHDEAGTCHMMPVRRQAAASPPLPHGPARAHVTDRPSASMSNPGLTSRSSAGPRLAHARHHDGIRR
ncbi:helix-turn-helix domain-containing protein [Streptomyces sp. NPDC021356]|uniref:helix-turn-helix domain-containing protein n=1 Tax=Streptomyces sp. NPDC021356 TaxID=3154900 RepID=UPI0033F0458F